MNKNVRYLWAGILLVSLVSTGQAVETKVPLKDLPPSVRKTVEDLGKGATLRQVVSEVDKGKTVYEAQLIANGHTRDVSINAEGTVMETEEETTLANVPSTVRSALEKSAGAGKIVKVEVVTRADHSAIYEGVVAKGTEKSEIRVDSLGNLLPAE